MVINDLSKIWNERAMGYKIPDIAKRYGLSVEQVREILSRAPERYKSEYNNLGRLTAYDFDAKPPKKRHDKI